MSFDVSAKLFQKCLPALLLLSSPVYADDVMVITADRIKSNTDKSTSDVKIITAQDIQKTSTKTLPELLSKESDLNVATSGPNGSNASLFLRGTDSSHTLVVIDGIVMNDPSNPNRQFDIGRLSLNNIEKIEILKGSQGLAYGSNAIGGVIVITTKRAKGTEASGEVYGDFGTFNTVNAGGNVQKKIGIVNFSFGLDAMKTEGFSAADIKFNPGAEKDGDKRVTLDTGIGVDLSNSYTLDANIRFVHNNADLDKGGGPGQDDPNDTQTEEELYTKLQLTKNWESGNAETKFSYNRSKHYRNLDIVPDSKDPTSRSTVSKGEINAFALNHTYFIAENLTQNINFDWQKEEDQSKHSNQNTSGFLYHQYELPTSIFNFGIRLDHNQIFNEHLTYKAAAGYKITDGLWKISYSTGFRAPSLNQLFDPVTGNQNLNPETSQNTELAFEKRFSENVKNISALFYTKIKNRFSYTLNPFKNINHGAAEISGFEETINVNWTRNFSHNLSFTLLKTQDLSTGEKLARRPDINVKNVFTYQLGDQHFFSYELSFISQRLDVDNNGNTVRDNAYLISNVNYRYVVTKQYELYLKIKNLLNKDYEEIYGYGTGGRAVTLGAHYNF